MRRKILTIAFVGTGLIVAASSERAWASSIPTLFNTGVATNDANGNPTALVADNTSDPHYNIISAASPDSPGAAVVTIQGGYPFGGTWQNDSSTSKWISPHGNESTIEVVGEYIYQTTFDLTGFDPTTAQIAGSVWVDNYLTDIVLNSSHTGITASSFSGPTPFAITTGFVAGDNTLDFYVTNGPTGGPQNPSGLRVDLSGSAAPTSSTPEPASLGILGLGAAALLVRRRRNA